MDENEKSDSEPMLIIESFRNGEHIVKKVPYSSLSIDQLVSLAMDGSLSARNELDRRVGVDVYWKGEE